MYVGAVGYGFAISELTAYVVIQRGCVVVSVVAVVLNADGVLTIKDVGSRKLLATSLGETTECSEGNVTSLIIELAVVLLPTIDPCIMVVAVVIAVIGVDRINQIQLFKNIVVDG